MQKQFRLFVACFLILPFFTSAQTNLQNAPSEEALAELINTISQVQNEIDKRQLERSGHYQQLQETEQALAEISAEISLLESDMEKNEASLLELKNQSSELEEQRSSQQEIIGQYLRSAYQNGRQEYFKLLLNQENPTLAARTLRYYQYFSEARSDKVEEYSNTLNELQIVEDRIKAATDEMNQHQVSLSEQQDALTISFAERQQLLDDLDVILSSNNLRLAALEAERIEMELLIEELRRSIANLALGGQQQPFASLQGKLPWPIQGLLLNSWGDSFELGDLKWEGVSIAAPQGSDVAAIHHGRVVFSDWFSSSGLLLIIDHGDGYMSLYAHNQALFKEVGEWVNSGDIIASVGNTGGQVNFGLYFEIRHNGESVNPALWCSVLN